jgi:hypothetical protein
MKHLTVEKTVEKGGFTLDDNKNRDGLKLKFALLYTLNRMGAKTDKMQTAK